MEDRCPTCLHPRSYSPEYDAYYCTFCNAWLEEACSDPFCMYCANRKGSPAALLQTPKHMEFTIKSPEFVDLSPAVPFLETVNNHFHISDFSFTLADHTCSCSLYCSMETLREIDFFLKKELASIGTFTTHY